MNPAAFVLIVLAIVVFVCAYFKVARRWADTNLGLAFFAASFLMLYLLKTSHAVSFTWN